MGASPARAENGTRAVSINKEEGAEDGKSGSCSLAAGWSSRQRTRRSWGISRKSTWVPEQRPIVNLRSGRPAV